jgi:hypothetical protein
VYREGDRPRRRIDSRAFAIPVSKPVTRLAAAPGRSVPDGPGAHHSGMRVLNVLQGRQFLDGLSGLGLGQAQFIQALKA